MKGLDLQIRTKKFAINIIKLTKYLNNDRASITIGNQIVRSGTSVAANYRAACRAKSRKDFINKLAIVLEEADETMFWLELLKEAELIKEQLITDIYREAKEITAIMFSSRRSAARNFDHS